MKKNDIWVVTGASGGIGAVLVRQLLAAGHQVAALTRTPEKVLTANTGAAGLLAVETDIRCEQSVVAAHDKVMEHFGHVDVVVNTAGYGLGGAIEEVSDKEARDLFDVNYFGIANVCRNFIPDLRQQGGGYVFNFVGIESVVTTPYNALYHASKFAADALTESLSKEAAQFDIAAVSIKCGAMRTEYLANKRMAENHLEAYAPLRAEAVAADTVQHGHEIADPEKVAAFVIGLSEKAELPRSVYLTKGSVEMIRDEWTEMEEEFETWKWATLCVDFPKEECYHGKRS